MPLCLVWSSEGWEEAFATIRKSDGDSRKDVVFLTFDELHVGRHRICFLVRAFHLLGLLETTTPPEH